MQLALHGASPTTKGGEGKESNATTLFPPLFFLLVQGVVKKKKKSRTCNERIAFLNKKYQEDVHCVSQKSGRTAKTLNCIICQSIFQGASHLFFFRKTVLTHVEDGRKETSLLQTLEILILSLY